MSRFLAPIHTWLFNKIKITEELEQRIIKAYGDKYGEEIRKVVIDANKRYGKPLEDRPIEELIDSGNIHGWLHDRIAKAETRQADIIGYFILKYGEEAEKIGFDVFNEQAVSLAKQATASFDNETAIKIYDALNNYILEGMPCDNANNITIREDDMLTWKNTKCLHRGYWEIAGAPVDTMYALRFTWIKTFIETFNTNFVHIVKQDDKTFIHEIIKK